MTTGSDEYHQALGKRLADYAATLRASGHIRTESVERAFRTVPRHLCVPAYWRGLERVVVPRHGPVPAELLDVIYADEPLMTHIPRDGTGTVSSTSQPSLMADMLEALALAPGMRVLEIGAGTGYNAMLIATITGARVVAVDVGEQIVVEARDALDRLGIRDVAVLCGDGYAGHLADAPYDRIIVTVGCTGLSARWLDQLAPDGLVVAPVEHGGFHPVLVARVSEGGAEARVARWAAFMPASGALGWRGSDRPEATEVPATAFSTHAVMPAGLDESGYLDLWCFLAARDTRVTRAYMDGIDHLQGQCAVVDAERGTVFVQQDGVRLAGERSLLDDVTRLVGEWERLRRPRVSDWSCRLTRTGPAAAPLYAPSQWRLEEAGPPPPGRAGRPRDGRPDDPFSARRI